MKYIIVVCTILLFSQCLVGMESTLIIQLTDKVTVDDVRKQLPSLSFQKTLIPSLNIHLFSVHEKTASTLSDIKKHTLIQDAIWNGSVKSRNTYPNDPKYAEQWALERIALPKVWDITTGGKSYNNDEIVVAIIDQDFSTTHEDLKNSFWTNPNEIPNNGIDDDNNGYIDDLYGWNFDNASSSFRAGNHGTAISGVIGGQSDNNKGISGINWTSYMLYLQYGDRASTQIAEIFASYDYLTNLRKTYNESKGANGAFIVAVNASWGLPQTEICTASNLWNQAHDMMGEVGILTAIAAKNTAINSDVEGDIPSACPSDFIISVASTIEADNIWSRSAYGKNTIDIAAPGTNIAVPSGNDRYTTLTGNSLAAPHIAGAIALLYSLPCKKLADAALEMPAQTALLIKDALLKGVDKLQVLEDLLVTGGRLNVLNAVVHIEEYCTEEQQTNMFQLTKVFPNPASQSLSLAYQTPDNTPFEIRIYDVIGRLIHQKTVDPCCFKEQIEQFDLSAFSKGMYVLQANRSDLVKTLRFVVQ